MTSAVITALIALVSGAVGSLLAPWAQWGVEKRRERLAHRRVLVATWRKGLARWEWDAAANPATPPLDLFRTDWYGSLSPFLKKGLAGQERTLVVTPVGDRSGIASTLQGEIDRIEREWGLA
jgi:hypothetical protein